MKLKIFQPVSVSTLCLVLFFIFTQQTLAETFSGRVIDHNGNPVPDLTVELRKFNNDETELSMTDETGFFSVSGTDFPVKLNLHLKNDTPYEISMITIDGMIYFPCKHPNYADDFVFSIADGEDIKDVQIHVRKLTLIRGQVLNPDGTPLSNVDVSFNLSGLTLNGSPSIIRDVLIRLDADGYFEKYVDGPGYYTLIVKYKKEIATTEFIYITGKLEEDKLVLRLGGKIAANLNDEVKILPPRLPIQQREIQQIPPLTNLSLEQKSSITGRVMDTQGNIVSDMQISLQPMQLQYGVFFPEKYRICTSNDTTDEKSQTNTAKSKTTSDNIDNRLPPRNRLTSHLTSTGIFSFKEIEYGPLQLFVLPEDITLSELPSDIRTLDHFETKYEILSVKFGDMIFRKTSDQQSILSHIIFGIKPETKIDNIEITVKERTSITGRIVYADGTPLTNRNTELRIKEPQGRIVHLGDADGYTSSANIRTDDYGNFSIYIEKLGDYSFHVKYIYLTAEAGPITIKDNTQQNDLILKLNGKLIFPDTTSEDQAAVDEEQIPDVWVVNPSNGHSYKLIVCEDWHDAHLKATQNGAHLISINDNAEHKWIQEIYGSGFFWIGLNDLEKEGEWKWDGGEAVTYEVWEKNELFLDENLTDAEKDYVVMNLNGAWESTGPQSTVWFMTRQAILENDGLVSTIPLQSEPSEE